MDKESAAPKAHSDIVPGVDIFSHTVIEAEDKFAAAADRAGTEMVAHASPERGPHAEQFHVGVSRLGPTGAANVLLLISATHGVEGYAGAGIQTGLLVGAETLPLPDDTALVMIHMINPWGAAWGRRETEGNVDLFRNILYRDRPGQKDPLYDVIEESLNVRHDSGPERELADARLLQMFDEYGPARIELAIRRGQHDYAKGMTYHGSSPTWSTRLLDEVVDSELTGARRVAVVDVHTGWGPPGHGTAICYAPPASAAAQRLAGWHGALYYPGDDPAIPTHEVLLPYTWLEGRIPGCQSTFVSLEFGTEKADEAFFRVLRDSSHFHNYGDLRSPAAAEVTARYRQYFYPETDAWKHSVWQRGRQIVTESLTGLGDWARETA